MSDITIAASAVDVNVPRFNQAVVAAVLTVAFVADTPWIVAVVAAILVVSAVGGPRWAPLTRLYTAVIRPRLDPDGPAQTEDPRPPRFAQQLGAGFTGAATLAFVLGLPLLGWGLAVVVAALAFLAATSRICVGCIIYEKVLA